MGEVYNENYLPIYRYFYYKGISREHIKDLVHDVFLVFFQKYENKVGFDARKILYTISRNVYKQWVRKQKITVSFDEEYHFEEYYDDKFDDKFEQRNNKVISLINQLNDKVKEVMIYRFVDGLSRKEIANKLNISEEHVHTYQKRGTKYLKEMTKKQGLY